jgi:hypothetical protein
MLASPPASTCAPLVQLGLSSRLLVATSASASRRETQVDETLPPLPPPTSQQVPLCPAAVMLGHCEACSSPVVTSAL